MMIVLENVSATATYSEVTASMPRAIPMTNPRPAVNATWPRPVITATDPSERISLISSLMPTRNSRTAIPSSESSSIWASAWTISSTEGPATIPTAIKLTINGWRSSRPANPITAASISRVATSANAEWSMNSMDEGSR